MPVTATIIWSSNGRAAFEAFTTAYRMRGGSGTTWEALPEHIRAAWEQAAQAAINQDAAVTTENTVTTEDTAHGE